MARVTEWLRIIRIGCILPLTAFAYVAFDDTKSQLSLAESSRLEPELKAIFQSVDTGRGAIDAGSAEVARATLSANALDNQALAQLWLATAGMESELKRAKLLVTAGQVSRRSLSYLAAELLTAAQTEDVAGVVRAFDRMASLSPALRASLTKMAVPLLDDPEGARLLAQLNSRAWFVQFIANVIAQPARLDQVAKFLESAKVSDREINSRVLEMVTNAFLKRNMVVEAQAFAISFGEIKDADFNSLSFEQSQKILSKTLLTWQFPNPEAQPSLQENGSLKFSIKSGVGSQPLMEKMIVLKPGRHRLETNLTFSGSLEDALVLWRVRCGSLPIRQFSKLSSTAHPLQKKSSLEFETQETCPGVRLSLHLREPSRQFPLINIFVRDPEIQVPSEPSVVAAREARSF